MPNALAGATSPYLRQHQSNPVQWMPWSDAALERARQEGKPVLLSIGYAACHWCHVMARESFENPEIAALMNEHFVNIKVDREERPDVDAIYLRALQAMGKRAGWPLTMFLTPTGKPFWGGTYFPAVAKGQQISFREVLLHISDAYRSNPGKAEQRAAEVIDALRDAERASPEKTNLSSERVTAAAQDLLRNFDGENGGLTGAPKFPYPVLLRFLWNQGCRTGNGEMKDAVLLTLRRMIDGGIFDQLGGGISRYAIDAEWRVPHFEKMLYDNALLVHLLAEVWRTEKVDVLRAAAERTVGWVLRELKLPTGAFAASLDAESGGEEGGFYLWDETEVDQLLGPRAALFKSVYGVTPGGNFERRNVLKRRSDSLGLTETEEAELASARDILFRARSSRHSPRRDEKVLADWNGLMAAGLARAAIVFDKPEWLDAAAASFEFVAGRMAQEDSLFHSWCGGELSAASILDDYANMSLAAVTLYEATGHVRFLDRCKAWVERCLSQFRHPNGALYYTGVDKEFVTRICDGRDSATPSGNGIMAHVLARLYGLTGAERYREQAEGIVRSFAHGVSRDSYQLATLLDASEFLTSAVQVCIIGNTSAGERDALFRAAHRHGGVDQVVMLLDPAATLPSGHPAHGKGAVGGKPTAFVCHASTCLPPVFDGQALGETLRMLSMEEQGRRVAHTRQRSC